MPYCCERLRQDKREQLEDLHSTLHDYVKKRPPVKHLYDGALEIFQAYPPLKKSAAMDEVEEAWAMVTVRECKRVRASPCAFRVGAIVSKKDSDSVMQTARGSE